MSHRAKHISLTNETGALAPDSPLTLSRALLTGLGFGLLGFGLTGCNDAPALALVLGLLGIIALSFAQLSNEHHDGVRDVRSFGRALQAAALVSVRVDAHDPTPRPPGVGGA